MLSNPNCSANVTNATRSTTAARTQIWAVLSGNRVSVMLSGEGDEQDQPAAGPGARGRE